MKAAPFEYLRPASVGEACEALASDFDARVLAGGQTLVPMLAMRLSRPSLLVDITRLDEIAQISDGPTVVAVGAAVRQATALLSGLIALEVPLLAAALPHVGHPPTRARGTVGGSIAHGDPSAEIALAAAILDASLVFAVDGEEEEIAASEFFLGPTVTLAPVGGLLTHVVFPKRPVGRVGAGFNEVASRRSDYAFASAGAQVVLDEDGICTAALAGVGGVGDVPTPLDVSGLARTKLTDKDIAEAVAAAVDDLECVDDLHATATYRRRAAEKLAAQSIRDARDRAVQEAA